jgi:hypothetical protein
MSAFFMFGVALETSDIKINKNDIRLIGTLTSTITSYFFAANKKTTSKERIIKEIQEQLGDIDNLSSEDIDNLCAVLKALKVPGSQPPA